MEPLPSEELSLPLVSTGCLYQTSFGTHGRFLTDTPTVPNLIQGSCSIERFPTTCGATGGARALQHNRRQPAGTAQDLQEHDHHSEQPCNTPQENLRHVQAAAVRQVLSYLHPVDVGSASPTAFSHPFDDAIKEQSNDFPSDLGSPRTFSKHLCHPCEPQLYRQRKSGASAGRGSEEGEKQRADARSHSGRCLCQELSVAVLLKGSRIQCNCFSRTASSEPIKCPC